MDKLYLCKYVLLQVLIMTIHGISATVRREAWGKVVSGEEFCEYETFKAQCSTNEVVDILSAEYGHMDIGKCIKTDFGYFGCKADVTSLLERKCNGQHKCDLGVVGQELRSTKPCSVVGLTLYLKVSYSCFKVLPAYDCGTLSANPEQQYISLSQLYKPGCTSQHHVIAAQPGQKINITLISIMDKPYSDSRIPITALETNTGEQISLNGGITSTGISQTHSITVIIDDLQHKPKYVIGYRAMGCPDISSSKGIVVSRKGTEATVSCVHSDQSWTLVCRGIHWLGVIGNCTTPAVATPKAIAEPPPDEGPEHHLLLDKDVIYLIVVCTTIFLSVLVVTSGFVCLKRAQIRHRIEQPTKEHEWLGTAQMTKPRPNSDYMTPQYVPEAASQPQPAIYDIPLPDPPVVSTATRNTVKRNNEEDYTASLSSNSTDYTRKYFVLDRDYVNTKNLINM